MAEAKAWVMIPKSRNKGTEVELDMHPLVLCKDCKYCGDSNRCFVAALNKAKGIDWYPFLTGDWFCADGELKE